MKQLSVVVLKGCFYVGASVDMNLGKLWEIVRDREAWHAIAHKSAKSRTNSATERHQQPLCRLCEPSVFDVRAVLDVDASNIFSQGGLATISLIGSVASIEGLQSTQDVSGSSSLLSGSCCSVRVWDLLPSCWSECHEDWVHTGSVLFKCVCFSLSPPWHLCLKKGSAEASGACVLTEIQFVAYVCICSYAQT